MSIKHWIRRWIFSDDHKLEVAATRSGKLSDEDAMLSFAILKASNGYLIKASTYRPSQRGPDWTHELYIVKDDEKIPDVIARIMAIKALES
jgi:hypothetical protein